MLVQKKPLLLSVQMQCTLTARSLRQTLFNERCDLEHGRAAFLEGPPCFGRLPWRVEKKPPAPAVWMQFDKKADCASVLRALAVKPQLAGPKRRCNLCPTRKLDSFSQCPHGKTLSAEKKSCSHCPEVTRVQLRRSESNIHARHTEWHLIGSKKQKKEKENRKKRKKAERPDFHSAQAPRREGSLGASEKKPPVPAVRMQFDDKDRVAKATKRNIVEQTETKNRVELFRHLPQYVHGSQLPSAEAKFFRVQEALHPHPAVYQVSPRTKNKSISITRAYLCVQTNFFFYPLFCASMWSIRRLIRSTDGVLCLCLRSQPLTSYAVGRLDYVQHF